MKLLSITVPCYNSEAYMEKCVRSLLVGGDDVEIIIVNDGSKDRTAEIADGLQAKYPNIIKVIHKENGGHGSAVNEGLKAATGLFFKVVDSDDRVKEGAYKKVLSTLQELLGGEHHLDMMICNYVYDKVGEENHKVMQYRSFFPKDRIFTWKEAKRFHKGHYILMHSVIFRTNLLRECALELPEHCFYVDNLYVFEPLPFVKNMYYLDVNFYYYFIGREDQSVNQKVMISRLDQQIRVNKLMVDYFADKEIQARIKGCSPLSRYMYNYLEIITTVSSVLALNSNTEEDLKRKDDLWKYIREKDSRIYRKLRTGIFGIAMNLPGKGGRYLTVSAYKIARHFFQFN